MREYERESESERETERERKRRKWNRNAISRGIISSDRLIQYTVDGVAHWCIVSQIHRTAHSPIMHAQQHYQ